MQHCHGTSCMYVMSFACAGPEGYVWQQMCVCACVCVSQETAEELECAKLDKVIEVARKSDPATLEQHTQAAEAVTTAPVVAVKA